MYLGLFVSNVNVGQIQTYGSAKSVASLEEIELKSKLHELTVTFVRVSILVKKLEKNRFYEEILEGFRDEIGRLCSIQEKSSNLLELFKYGFSELDISLNLLSKDSKSDEIDALNTRVTTFFEISNRMYEKIKEKFDNNPDNAVGNYKVVKTFLLATDQQITIFIKQGLSMDDFIARVAVDMFKGIVQDPFYEISSINYCNHQSSVRDVSWPLQSFGSQLFGKSEENNRHIGILGVVTLFILIFTCFRKPIGSSLWCFTQCFIRGRSKKRKKMSGENSLVQLVDQLKELLNQVKSDKDVSSIKKAIKVFNQIENEYEGLLREKAKKIKALEKVLSQSVLERVKTEADELRMQLKQLKSKLEQKTDCAVTAVSLNEELQVKLQEQDAVVSSLEGVKTEAGELRLQVEGFKLELEQKTASAVAAVSRYEDLERDVKEIGVIISSENRDSNKVSSIHELLNNSSWA